MLVWSSNGDISNTHTLVLPTVTKLLHKIIIQRSKSQISNFQINKESK